MNRIGSALQRLSIMAFVLSVFMPLSMSTTMADEASTGEQSTEQASVQEEQETPVTDGEDVEEENDSSSDQSLDLGTVAESTGNTAGDEGLEGGAGDENAENTAGDENPNGGTGDENSENAVGDQNPDAKTGDETPENIAGDQNADASSGTMSILSITGDESQVTEVTPAQPTITGNTCVDGVYTRPSASFSSTSRVNYSDVDVQWTGTVYSFSGAATLGAGYTWASDLGDGWRLDDTYPNSARYYREFSIDSCAPRVTPAQPTISGSTCVDDVYTPPIATFGPTTGVTYSDVFASSYTNADGQVVVVAFATATLVDDYTWMSDLGEGWEMSSNGTAYFDGEHIAGSRCGEVVLAQPITTGNTCVDGTYTPPNVSFGPTEHVRYSNEQVSETVDGGYFVSAAADVVAGYDVAMPLESGWNAGKGWSYGGTIQRTSCEDEVIVTPVDPAVTQAVRTEGGAVTPPSATPATTEGITYTVDGDVVPGGTVTVRATPNAGYVLGPATGWSVNEDGSATFIVNLDAVEGEMTVTPVDPAVIQAVREESGTVTPPSATPATTEGITYTLDGDVAPGSTVTVTATPNAGYVLGPATGWTLQEDGSATFTVDLDAVQGEATSTATATATATSSPTPSPTSTATATPTATGTPTSSATSTTTTTATSSPTETATQTTTTSVTVTPENPEVAQAVRTDAGAVTPPSVTTATTEGVAYTVDGDVVPGGTVTVTARPNAGYVLGPATGWTLQGDGSATFIVHLHEVEGKASEAAVVPDETRARQDKPTLGSPVTALPSTGTGIEATGSHEKAILMLAAGTVLLAGFAVGIRMRGQRS